MGWSGGEAIFGEELGFYPIIWERYYTDSEERVLKNFSIIPGEVQAFKIHLVPESGIKPGVYYTRVMLIGLYAGNEFLIPSDKVVRVVVLGECNCNDIWDWRSEFLSDKYEGSYDLDDNIEKIRRGAYFESINFFEYLKLTTPANSEDHKMEIALSQSNSINAPANFEDLWDTLVSNYGYYENSKYSWLIEFIEN